MPARATYKHKSTHFYLESECYFEYIFCLTAARAMCVECPFIIPTVSSVDVVGKCGWIPESQSHSCTKYLVGVRACVFTGEELKAVTMWCDFNAVGCSRTTMNSGRLKSLQSIV